MDYDCVLVNVKLIVNTCKVVGVIINKFNVYNMAYFTLHWSWCSAQMSILKNRTMHNIAKLIRHAKMLESVAYTIH